MERARSYMAAAQMQSSVEPNHAFRSAMHWARELFARVWMAEGWGGRAGEISKALLAMPFGNIPSRWNECSHFMANMRIQMRQMVRVSFARDIKTNSLNQFIIQRQCTSAN